MITINLLPVRESRKKEVERKTALVMGSVIGCTLLVIIAIHMVVSSRISKVNDQIRTTQVELDKINKVIGDVATFKKDKESIEKKLAVIHDLEASRGGPVHILDELASKLPEKIWLTALTEESGSLTLQGMSIDNETIATYMTRLGQSPFLKDIELERSELKEGESVKLNEFTIRCLVVNPPSA
jgi:type IV pilus assembly protein PilN